MSLFIGEASGARVLAVSSGLHSVGTDHQGDVTTWDVAPADEMGDCVFRSVGVSFTASNGWSIGVTVYVDGVSLGETAFGGDGATENGQAQVFVKRRGTTIAVRVRTLSRTGTFSISNIQCSYLAMRMWP
jgi:hypothetical protein